MNIISNRKRLQLSAYRVQFVDMREPKPRTEQEETYVVDQDFLDAVGLVCGNVTDIIRNRYEKAGYRVGDITKESKKRTVYIDLNREWTTAAHADLMPSTVPDPATPTEEGGENNG